jgi:predicted O-methyltransferase YrrM
VPAGDLASEPLRHQFPVRAAVAAFPRLVRIPKVQLETIFPGIGQLEISLQHDTLERALGHGEAFVLSLITAWLKPRRVFEIGTASGQGTLLMARQAPEARIDTLDLGNERPSLGQQRGQPPWQDLDTVGRAYKASPHAGRVHQHFADSALFDFAPFRGLVDLVFVDGGHTYNYVASDSRNALDMIGSDGVIVWDDCNALSPGVSRALLELRRGGERVYRIVGTRLAVLSRAGEKLPAASPAAG